MAVKIVGNVSNTGLEVDTYAKSVRTSVLPHGGGYAVSGLTGNMVAGMSANGTVWAMRMNPGSSSKALISNIRLKWTTIAAFTTKVFAGRRLELFRGAGNATSGGSGIAVAPPLNSDLGVSDFSAASGGDIRIATTSTLTVSGITFETSAIDGIPLTDAGDAGASVTIDWNFESHPIILNPGELIAIRNPSAMDVGGTWQLGVHAKWIESSNL